MLKNKTVLLVTHQVHYLTDCDILIIIENGSVQHMGTPNDLKK
jgi:ABC-type transport system involved in cytochrome bd biosynthesis fused ATPase/permease subunit